MTPRHAPDQEQNGCARLGLIIAKRFAAKSVTRNAIKRVIREAFRQKRADLPACDLVFRLHSKLERSEEHTSELQSLMRTSYAVFCLYKKRPYITHHQHN